MKFKFRLRCFYISFIYLPFPTDFRDKLWVELGVSIWLVLSFQTGMLFQDQQNMLIQENVKIRKCNRYHHTYFPGVLITLQFFCITSFLRCYFWKCKWGIIISCNLYKSPEQKSEHWINTGSKLFHSVKLLESKVFKEGILYIYFYDSMAWGLYHEAGLAG